MTQNFFTKATGIEQYDNTQEMNTTLFPESLQDVFTQVISSHLHIDHINNVYGSCKEMYKQLDKSITYIYKKICLHHQPHSIDDLPAMILSNGDHHWYKEGIAHRDGDLPAKIRSNGDQEWYKEGKQHRDGDLPAGIWANGDQEWYKEGKQHRDGDLPA
jgi:ribonuclease BN (tRNA processing enzyme)